jgi:hypothetical protein
LFFFSGISQVRPACWKMGFLADLDLIAFQERVVKTRAISSQFVNKKDRAKPWELVKIV